MTKPTATLSKEQASEIVSGFSTLLLVLKTHELLSQTDMNALANIEGRMMNKIVKLRPNFINELWKASN